MKHILQAFEKSHAVLIGINDYHHLHSLNNAINDIEEIARVLETEAVHDYEIQKLINPTHQDLEQLLFEQLPKRVGQRDRLLFYFAGHGIADASNEDGIPEGYLLPVDAALQHTQQSLAMHCLYEAVETLPCRHVLFVLDCCFSGAFRWMGSKKRGIGVSRKKVYRERAARFTQDPAWQVITSTAHDQEALDGVYNHPIGSSRNNGASHFSPFAYHFLNAIQGEADLASDQPDGLITATDVYLYIRDKLEPATIQLAEHYRQTPGLFHLPKHDKGEYIFLSPKVTLNLPTYNPGLNPYKGLQAYEPTDASHFFGREAVIQELLERIHQQKLVIVAGASGTGKSSLVKAGIIPRLMEEDFVPLMMRPGHRPVEQLQLLLPDLQPPEDYPCVLVIDQFEEVITLCHDEEERAAFLDSIKVLVSTQAVLKICITIRSDFEPQFEASSLGPIWQEARYVVPGFTSRDLHEIIEQPAFQRVILFDPPDLPEKIVEDVQNAPGALPLLSFTMSELYEKLKERGDFGAFKKADYEVLGGVIGSLRTQADKIYEGLDAAHQTTMRKIILRMVSLEGEELAKRRVIRTELDFQEAEENRRVKHIVAQLVKARLIVSGNDAEGHPYVEPAHDALIRAWGTLWGWITQVGKDKLLLLNKLNEATEQYFAPTVPNPKDLWHNNPRLATVRAERQWLNAHEKVFVSRSINRKNRNRNILVSAGSLVILVLSVLSIFALGERNKAVEALYQNGLTTAEAAKNTGNYQAALTQLEALERDLSESSPRFWRAHWDSVQLLRQTIDQLQKQMAEGNLAHKRGELVLAVQSFQRAATISQDTLILTRLASVEEERKSKFDDLVQRANRMIDISDECKWANSLIEKAAKLQLNTTEQKMMQAMEQKIKDCKKKNQ